MESKEQKKFNMSTLHIYLSNFSSRLILQSPLVQVAEQWREWSRSTQPIVFLTHSKIRELDYEAKHYLVLPVRSEAAGSLVEFVNQRGGAVEQKLGLEGRTLTGLNFLAPWVDSENPESVGTGSERGGVIEVVELTPYGFRYLHIDSKLVQLVARWKMQASYNGVVMLWTTADIEEEESPSPFTRVLAPVDKRYGQKLLEFIREDRTYASRFVLTPNPGSFADPWGAVESVSCIFKHYDEPRPDDDQGSSSSSSDTDDPHAKRSAVSERTGRTDANKAGLG